MSNLLEGRITFERAEEILDHAIGHILNQRFDLATAMAAGKDDEWYALLNVGVTLGLAHQTILARLERKTKRVVEEARP